MPEIVSEYHIARERVCKRVIERKHFKQTVALYCVQVTIGQSPYIRGGLSDEAFLPEEAANNVAFAQNGHHLVVLDDLERATGDEAQEVETLAAVVDDVAGRTVNGGEVHGQCPQTAVAGQAECWMFVEDFSIEVNADVGLHVLWAVVENPRSVYALGDCPCGDYIVHDTLLELFGHVVEFEEFAHIVVELVVSGCAGHHLRKDR